MKVWTTPEASVRNPIFLPDSSTMIIKASEENRLPDQIMITVHPQR